MRVIVVFVVGVRGGDVGFAGVVALVEAFLFYALALFAWQRAEVLVVVVGVHPDAARWVFGDVDEELVLLDWVECSHPAFRQRAALVLH